MTDRIDLDERTDERTDDDPAETPGHPDDWIWREDADPVAETPTSSSDPGASTPGRTRDTTAVSRESTEVTSDGMSPRTTADSDPETDQTTAGAIPHVPHPNKGKPAGIPVESGGSGGGTAGAAPAGSAGDGGDQGGDPATVDQDDVATAGPHGGGVDEMTLAFTFAAIQRVSNPAAVLADAAGWTDWVGIVGDVDAHVINKFQRDHGLDVDFFNGTGTGPSERLAAIGPHSMFYADRMVVVGLEDRDEHVASDADWEFVSLATAAANAGWHLADG